LINVSRSLTINAEKLTGLDLGSLEEVGYLSISNTLLTELDLSSLIELTESGVTNSTSISNNSNLVSIDLSALVLVRSSAQIYYSRNNLSSNSVFPYISILVNTDIGEYGVIDLSSQITNAGPTGQGLIDKQTLEDRGVNVQTD
jgi:hypothetical protein